MTDPIADMLTRIRNAVSSRHQRVDIPASKLKAEVARILQDEGYIAGFKTVEEKPARTGAYARPLLRVFLKYGPGGERVITGIERVSRPGRRVYATKDRLPRVLGGMGTAIMSTSNGLVTSRTAQELGVGGEVVCFVW